MGQDNASFTGGGHKSSGIYKESYINFIEKDEEQMELDQKAKK